MIMKANKQIGFIYKDEESIDKILKDGEVVFEKGFLREKTSTTLPITFGGVGKDLKDYRVYGNTKQQLLPDGYTQIDYIESSGTQYIDTGYYGNLNTEVQLKATNSSSNLDRQLFGDITTSSQAISCNLSLSTRLTSRFGNKSVGLTFGDYVSENEIFTLIENKDGIYINNSQIATFDTIDNFSTPNSLLLLTRNSTSGAGTVWNGKLYYAKIYDNNMLVRDFIPCYRNSDNEVGLYDLVNNVFYTNQGTGVFTYGSVAPTPDAPIEMVSCGDKTKNLFDKNNADIINAYFEYNNVGSLIALTQPNDRTLILKCQPNTTYTISKLQTSRFRVASYSSRVNSGQLNNAVYNNTATSITITTGANDYYLYVHFWNYNDTLTEQQVLDSIQIEVGSTATTYEPYGYKIPVNVRSDNLFDKSNANIITAYIGENYNWVYSGSAICYRIKCKPNTSYTITCFNPNETIFRGAVTDSENVPTSGNPLSIQSVVRRTDNTPITINTRTNTKYILVQLSSSQYLTSIETLQIVEGSTTPSKYIPYYNQTTNIYLDEPLRKIDGYSDYIDFVNGKVVKNIKEHIFTGTNDDNYVFNSDNTNTLGINILPNKIDSPALKPMSYMGPPIICNKFDYLNDITDKEHIYSSNGQQIDETKRISNIRLYLNKSRLEGYSSSMINAQKIELLKTWLSSNNITVDYILLTPTEESITLPNIPTIDGNNTLNIETEITPSQVYIKYKSNT